MQMQHRARQSGQLPLEQNEVLQPQVFRTASRSADWRVATRQEGMQGLWYAILPSPRNPERMLAQAQVLLRGMHEEGPDGPQALR